jgi:hypothetical protein
LPQVIALVISSIIAGITTSKIGYYTPVLIVGICIWIVGTGLLTTFQVDTDKAKWIGYQVVYGFGAGLCAQAPNMAAQTVLPRDQVSIGASLMLFAQTLFGAIFVSIGQNVLDGHLASGLAGITNITAQQIQNAGATGILDIIPPESRDASLVVYNNAIRAAFQVALIVTCLAIFGGIGMEWRSVKKQDPPATAPADVESEAGMEETKERADSTDKEEE